MYSADDGADSEEDSDFDDITSPVRPLPRERDVVGGSKRKPAAAGVYSPFHSADLSYPLADVYESLTDKTNLLASGQTLGYLS